MFDWHNEESAAMLSRGYLLDGETVISATRRIARSAAKYADNPGLEQRVFDLIAKGWFVPASPIWANMGTDRGLPISCFGSHVEDSMDGILSTLAEVGMMTKIGGGTSAYFGAIRHNGAEIKMNGKSNGPVPFMQLYDTAMRVVSQGSTRRGSFAAYLPVEHPDILEFLKIKDIGFYIQDISFGVSVTDNWMKDMIAGDPKKREVWASVLHSRKEKGYPYILFHDTVNKMKPECYKDRPIYASNLCVAPEQLLLTSEGYLPIGTLEGKEVTVWNGSEWSKTTVIKTSDDAELLKVRFSDQTEINCTPWHKFYVVRSYGADPVEVRAHELQPGDKMQKYSLPTDIDLGKCLQNAYSLGFYSGDGNEGYRFSYVYKEKESVIKRLFGSVTEEFDNNGRKRWTHGHIEDKFFVPLGYSVKSKVDWFSGYLDADGCVIESDNCQNIQVTSVNLDFIKKVRLMLQELGVQSSLGLRRDAGEYLLPLNDGSGESGLYDCKTVWLLNVNGAGVKRLLDIGLSTERLIFNREQKPNRDASRFVTVESVEKTGRRDKTYCATEPIRHRLVFNGVLTGNCSEIMLPSNKDESFVCCISAMNAEKWDEWKDTDAVRTAVEFLDAVMEEFIQKSQGINHMQRAVRFAKNHRAIGLGLCGWHSLLQSKGYPFNSLASFSLTHSMMGKIRDDAEKASGLLALSKGLPQAFPGLDRRNTTLMAIAPNTSSSSIMGQISAGIEPYESNYFVKDLAKGSFTRKNKHLEKILEERGLNTEDTWRNIHKAGGSVLGIPEIKDVHQVFLTFGEINQFELLRQAGLRQQFIDQGQSLNIHVPPGTDLKTINKLHIAAWQAGVKALYYQRSRSASQGFSLQDVCSMCSG